MEDMWPVLPCSGHMWEEGQVEDDCVCELSPWLSWRIFLDVVVVVVDRSLEVDDSTYFGTEFVL